MKKLIGKAKDFIAECWHSNTNRASIFEFLTPNCLHQKTIGKCIGIESFLADCNDWAIAFPDYGTEVKHIEGYRNLVMIDVQRTGRHLERYRSTNSLQKSVLTKSDFVKRIEQIDPSGLAYNLPAKLIFAFNRDRISQVIIEENPFDISLQLGLLPTKRGLQVVKNDCAMDRQILEDAIFGAIQVSLTRREIDCIALGFCGFSAKHISEILGISYRTVESFFSHAYQKLGCYGKQQVVEMMYEIKIISIWLDLGKLILDSNWRPVGEL